MAHQFARSMKFHIAHTITVTSTINCSQIFQMSIQGNMNLEWHPVVTQPKQRFSTFKLSLPTCKQQLTSQFLLKLRVIQNKMKMKKKIKMNIQKYFFSRD